MTEMAGGFENPADPQSISADTPLPGAYDGPAGLEPPALEMTIFLPGDSASAEVRQRRIDLQAAKAVLSDLTEAASDLADVVLSTARLQGDDFNEQYRAAVAEQLQAPDAATGHFGRRAAELEVLSRMMPADYAPEMQYLQERYGAELETGIRLEGVVVDDANRQATGYRQRLAAETDWAAVLDARLALDDQQRSSMYSVVMSALYYMHEPDTLPTAHYDATAIRDQLYATYGEVVANGHILPDGADAWAPPDAAWRPTPYFGQEALQWKRDVYTASEMVALARAEFLICDQNFQIIEALAPCAEAMGMGNPGVFDLPPQLVYEVETRHTAARDRFNAADRANIADLAAKLPYRYVVDDPYGLANLIGATETERWLFVQLQNIPQEMQHGIARIRFAPAAQARTFTYKGKEYPEKASYAPNNAEITLFIDPAHIMAAATKSNMDLLVTQMNEASGVSRHMVHEVMHHAHSWRLPFETLVQFNRLSRLADCPVSAYAGMAADPASPWHFESEQFADSGLRYYQNLRALRQIDTSYHHQAFNVVHKAAAGVM